MIFCVFIFIVWGTILFEQCYMRETNKRSYISNVDIALTMAVITLYSYAYSFTPERMILFGILSLAYLAWTTYNFIKERKNNQE